jgi:hypothetical protein
VGLHVVVGVVADAVGGAHHRVGTADQFGQPRQGFLLTAIVVDQGDAQALGELAVLGQQGRPPPT